MKTLPPHNSFPIPRRTVLQAGGLLGTSALLSLLVGCGGGDGNPNDSLPEGYNEAYVRDLSDNEGNYFSSQLVGVTETRDVLIFGSRYSDYPLRDFRLVRYKDPAQAGGRSEWILPKMFPDSVPAVVFASTTGQIFLSRFLVDDIPPEGNDNEFAVVNPDGKRLGTVTLAKDPGMGDTYPIYSSLSVSPNGDFYCAGGDNGMTVLKWNSTGSFVKAYADLGNFSYNGYRTAFAPNGTLRTLGYDDNLKTLVVTSVENRIDDPVPIRTNGYPGYQLQIDAAGNIYFLCSEPGTRSVPTRMDPPPQAAYMRKFSPTGTELAAVQVGSFHGVPPFFVDREGTVYIVIGGELYVFQRTR